MVVLCGLLASDVFTQNCGNLVFNGDFEQYSSCPDGQAQINKALGWRASSHTPDYRNTCFDYDLSLSFGTRNFTSPTSNFGYEEPYSGEGYMGIHVASQAPEYAITELTEPLTIGETYYVEFKYSLADSMGLAFDGLEVLFKVNPPLFTPLSLYERRSETPQIKNPGVFLTQKNGWGTVSGTFVADSAYTHLILGNFTGADSVLTTSYSEDSKNKSYYFIDDVSVLPVTKTDTICEGDTLFVGNNFYTQPGYYTDTMVIAPGDTNLTCGVLSVSPTYQIKDTVNLCNGDSALIGGNYYKNHGDSALQYLTTSQGCDSILISFINVWDTMDISYSTYNSCDLPSGEIDITVSGGTPPYEYLWSNNDTTEDLFNVVPEAYTLAVTDSISCVKIITALLEPLYGCYDLYIPNSFTPNSDDINAVFMPIFSDKIGHYTMTIFDRWGKNIFRTNDSNKGWNGRIDNTKELVPSGLYLVRITCQFEGANELYDKTTPIKVMR